MNEYEPWFMVIFEGETMTSQGNQATAMAALQCLHEFGLSDAFDEIRDWFKTSVNGQVLGVRVGGKPFLSIVRVMRGMACIEVSAP